MLLFPFSLLYDMATRIRNYLYLSGLLKVYTPQNKTIVVGNLSMGGSGKTPVSEYLLRLLIDNQISIAYLSRGYKRKSKGFYQAKDEVNYLNTGDEAFQIHRNFPLVPVLLAEKRVTAIQTFQQENNFEGVFILDDAYQHRQIKCGFSILLTSFHKPYFNDFLLPAGNLRESGYFASEADIIIVTKCPETLSSFQKEDLLAKLKVRTEQQVFFSWLNYGKPLHAFTSKKLDTDLLKEASIVVFTGIADPQPLYNYLKLNCKNVKSLWFSDHQDFSDKHLKRIIDVYHAITDKEKYIFTTEKDFARIINLQTEKLLENLPLYILPVEIKFFDNQQDVFNQIILDYVGKNK